MPDVDLIPGECDVREWVRAALLDYAVFLSAQSEAWALRHGRQGVTAPTTRSLDAEACAVSVGMFRSFFAGLPPRLAPLFVERPEAALTARLN
jgi:hypothetical protein